MLANTCRFLFNSASRVHDNYVLKSIVKAARTGARPARLPSDRTTFDLAPYFDAIRKESLPVVGERKDKFFWKNFVQLEIEV